MKSKEGELYKKHYDDLWDNYQSLFEKFMEMSKLHNKLFKKYTELLNKEENNDNT